MCHFNSSSFALAVVLVKHNSGERTIISGLPLTILGCYTMVYLELWSQRLFWGFMNLGHILVANSVGVKLAVPYFVPSWQVICYMFLFSYLRR